MITLDLCLDFKTPGYIAEPYWPEMYEVINITKQSGMNRSRTEANRRKALEEYLTRNGMTLADYEALERKSKEPFHTNGGEIIIPENQIYGFLVNATSEARAAARPCDPAQIRSVIAATPWRTGKTAPDGEWRRFVTVQAGTGAKLSNQRGLRASKYIANFTATGLMSVDETFVKPDVVLNLIRYGGANIGIGASRKMGWGRFVLT